MRTRLASVLAAALLFAPAPPVAQRVSRPEFDGERGVLTLQGLPR